MKMLLAQVEQFEARLAKQKPPYKIRREIPLLYADYYLAYRKPGSSKNKPETRY